MLRRVFAIAIAKKFAANPKIEKGRIRRRNRRKNGEIDRRKEEVRTLSTRNRDQFDSMQRNYNAITTHS